MGVLGREALYPDLEKALLALASLDVVFTHAVLKLGGFEANPIAAAVIEHGGPMAMSLYKFSLTAIVVLIFEYIGTRRLRTGQFLAGAAVGANMYAVVTALLILPSLVVAG